LIRALERSPTVRTVNQPDEALGDIADNMDFKTGREIALIGIRLLDDAYMAWVAAESEAGEALRAWSEGASGRRRAGEHAYRAAVDREEAAARDLQRLHELTAVCLEALVEADEHVPEQVCEGLGPDELGDAHDTELGADPRHGAGR
jgi:hypothetical protein